MLRNTESNIIESQSISDILKYITFNTWVLLDLDNSVMESLIDLGSDQWFSKLIEHACEHMPENRKEAVDMVITLYQAVQHHIVTKAVEPHVVHLIKALQDIGVPVLAVTARDRSLIDTTFRQLEEIGIDFSRGEASHGHAVQLLNDDGKQMATYHGGIIFCDGNDKGKCVNALFKKSPSLPKHLVVFDDKGKYLLQIAAAAKAYNIDCDGLRYGYLDEKVKNVDMNAAYAQLQMIKDKLPPIAQAAMDKLKMHLINSSASSAGVAMRFAPDPHKKSQKRKYEEEIIHVEDGRPERSSSALSFFHRKITRLNPKDEDKMQRKYMSNNPKS